MAGTDSSGKLLPGVLGKDYIFRSYGGQTYVVYTINVYGRNVKLSWKINDGDLDAYGVKKGKVHHASGAEFHNWNHLGNASEVIQNGTDHPWVQYLNHLQELYGHASWLQDKGFMSTMLEGFFEGWSTEETQQALKTTSWYQNRTQTQRNWINDMSKADRNAAIGSTTASLNDILRNLYGPDWRQSFGMSDKELADISEKIASGVYGTPDEGLQIWSQKLQRQAEQVEGTPAWIAMEQELEQQRDFMNRPENMFQQLKDQSMQWLGPQGVLDDTTLKGWADKLVTEQASDADWEQFLQGQAKNLYPWLGPNESWQDRASSYRSLAQQQLGIDIGWNDRILGKIGQTDADGNPTGHASTFDEFIKTVRSDPRFWDGQVAHDEVYSLLDQITKTFTGA